MSSIVSRVAIAGILAGCLPDGGDGGEPAPPVEAPPLERLAGTDVGNPVVQELGLGLAAQPGPVQVVDRTGQAFEVQAAQGQLRGLTVALGDGRGCADVGRLPGGWRCAEDPARLVGQGTWQVDLLTGALQPAVRLPNVPVAQVEAQVHQALSLTLMAERAHRLSVPDDTALVFQAAPSGRMVAPIAAWVAAADVQRCTRRADGSLTAAGCAPQRRADEGDDD